MKRYWFTFIEIMIAILVFSIWIFAVLSLMTSNLRWLERNDLRLQGTLFAKEWLELVYNLRDSNLERELPWNCILNPDYINKNSQELVNELAKSSCVNDALNCLCPRYFGIWSSMVVSYMDGHYVFVKPLSSNTGFDNLFAASQLYQHTWHWITWYSHENWWEATVFARYITFDSIVENVWEKALDADKILKVSSHVLWQKWWYTWEVVLSSFIWNY